MSERRILLVRHGKAEDEHPLGDEARGLTSEGRTEMREHVRELVERTRITGIATSPLVRAVQTAEILAEACGLDQVVVRGELAFGTTAKAIEALARTLGPGWALVGHNPSMADALAWLTGWADGEPRFRKGAIAALTPGKSYARPWTLDWMAAPGKKLKKELEVSS